jgi:GST-like protein
MITLYTHATPNGHKVSIMLEELGLPYEIRLVDLLKGEQFNPEFLAINPNNKIPAIVDPDGPGGAPITVWESGAILVYLADKTGSELLPRDLRRRTAVLQWLMFQMANVGPMFGQAGHFVMYAKEQVPYGIERYTKESRRILGVLDGQLGRHRHLAGEDYSIADIATFPWTTSALRVKTLGDFAEYPNLRRWRAAMEARPAVQRGVNRPPRSA